MLHSSSIRAVVSVSLNLQLAPDVQRNCLPVMELHNTVGGHHNHRIQHVEWLHAADHTENADQGNDSTECGLPHDAHTREKLTHFQPCDQQCQLARQSADGRSDDVVVIRGIHGDSVAVIRDSGDVLVVSRTVRGVYPCVYPCPSKPVVRVQFPV